MKYVVQIIKKATGEIVETVGEEKHGAIFGMSIDKAIKVERGIIINLNNKQYKTKIVKLNKESEHGKTDQVVG